MAKHHHQLDQFKKAKAVLYLAEQTADKQAVINTERKYEIYEKNMIVNQSLLYQAWINSCHGITHLIAICH